MGITTKSAALRLSLHVQTAKRKEPNEKNPFKNNWIRSLVRAGFQPEIAVQVHFADLPSALAWEVSTIARLKIAGYRLTNATNGGEGTVGYVASRATRLKQALAKIGKPGNHVQPHSEATKQRLREVQTGKRLALETRQKISRSNTGKHNVSPSVEMRQHLSAALKGRPWSATRRAAQKIRTQGVL